MDEEDKITMKSLVLIGLKYPLSFYPVFAFVRRRLRKLFAFRPIEARESSLDFAVDNSAFQDSLTREQAQALTARAIVSDVAHAASGRRTPRFALSPHPCKPVRKVTPRVWRWLKDAFGFRTARALVLESGLPQELPDPLSEPDEPDLASDATERLTDTGVKRDFVYAVGSGRRAWVEAVRAESGELLRETWDRLEPEYYYES